MRLALLALSALLAGCGTLQQMPAHEKAFHALNLIDTGQTVHQAREPMCWREVGFPSRQLVGSHPSELEVYGLMAGYSLAYHKLSQWRPESRFGRVAKKVVIGVTLVAKGAQVVENDREGVRPWGNGC